MQPVAEANEEAVEAWNGVLFDRFLQYRDILVSGLGIHGDEAMRVCPPQPGERVLDVGCGFGDTTRQLADLVGPGGEAVGIDAAERFVEVARAEQPDLAFLVGDVQAADLGGPYDYAFARFGTMFFANPVAAMRNIRQALRPGGRLCMVVWRRKLDNDWLHRAEQVVERFVTEPEDSDEPTCGPGPFSMADADTTSQILLNAGFEDVVLRRCDREFRFGMDLDKGVELVMALGPAGEIIRLAGAEAEQIRPQIESALREALAGFETDDGVRALSSTWIVTASAPS